MLKVPPRFRKLLTNHSTLLGLVIFSIGLLALCLLSQEPFNQATLISENALLVGQVVETFSSAEDLNFYSEQVSRLIGSDIHQFREWLWTELTSIGLEVSWQNFTFRHSVLHPLDQIHGSNLYAIMRSPSGGRSEALVLTVPLRDHCADTECLVGSVSVLLAMLKLFRTQIYWAKDIVLVFPEFEYIGLSAWLEAYHGTRSSPAIVWSELEVRSGNIQAGLNVELAVINPRTVDISTEGLNGVLANLDLVNTAVRIARKHGFIPVINGQDYWASSDWLDVRALQGLAKGFWSQATGSPTGLHSLLMSYQIPAVTLRGPSQSVLPAARNAQPRAAPRLLEGILRSLNNLQERMHASYWYYLLPNPMRFVPISIYMAPVLLMVAGLLVKILPVLLVDAEITEDVVLDSSSKPTQSSTSDQTDRGQVIRKRTQCETLSGPTVEKSVESAKPRAASMALEVLRWIDEVGWRLGLSFGAGLSLYLSPPLMTLLLSWNQDLTFAEWLPRLLAGFLTLFTLSTPLLSARSSEQSAWLSQLSLAAWALFLGHLAVLNVSACVLLALALVPTLLLVSACQRNRLARVFGAVCWLAVSPAGLLVLGCALNAVCFDGEWDLGACVQRGVVQSLLEADLFGSWVWPALTLGYASLWMFTWINLWSSS